MWIGRCNDWNMMNTMPRALYALYRQGMAVRRALGALSRTERLQALLWADAWCLLTHLTLDQERWRAVSPFGVPPLRLH